MENKKTILLWNEVRNERQEYYPTPVAHVISIVTAYNEMHGATNIG